MFYVVAKVLLVCALQYEVAKVLLGRTVCSMWLLRCVSM